MVFFTSRNSPRPRVDKRRGRRALFIRHLRHESLEDRTLLATFIVDNVNNSGVGSLRQAMADANDNVGLDIILFSIPGAGVHTITPNFLLPDITDPVIINATTQSGWTPNTPMIELDGRLTGDSIGLHFTVGGNTVQGLVINNFTRDGIVLAEPSSPAPSGGNTIQLNFLGTDATGMVAKPNRIGLHLVGSPNNVIKQNLISGNTQSGIEIDFAESSGNVVQGNNIGGDITGLNALGNELGGIFIGAPNVPFLREHPETDVSYASGNLIGGLDLDLGNLEPLGNLIVGNGHSGVHIFRGSDNQVQGNYIGVGGGGNVAIPNGTVGINAEFGADGVFIEEGHDNSVGGVEPGAGNVISANIGAGVRIRANKRFASDNVIQGNRIGTDASGHYQEGLGNQTNGIEITNTTDDLSGNVSAGNFIGGDDELDGEQDGNVGARNIISGNGGDGILIAGHFLETVIQGNYIGIDIDGQSAAPNGRDGIRLTAFAGQDADASVTIIGSADPARHEAGNLISGNVGNGIFIGFGAKGQVFGNAIGVNKDVSEGVGNGRNGIVISDSSGNAIGGQAELEGEPVTLGNIISANGDDGVQISGTSSENHLLGNFIGVDINQSDQLGNGRHGVAIFGAASNHIGNGSAIGRNVIVNNKHSGVHFNGTDAKLNTLLGNFIGVNVDGTTPRGNQIAGVFLLEAVENTIGGTGGDRNLISANLGPGVQIEGGRLNKVLNNSIGSDVIGEFREGLGNFASGVVILGSAENTVRENDIHGNGVLTGSGVAIGGAAATGNKIESNHITRNSLRGVNLFNGASGNHIGGDESDAGNFISANDDGVFIEDMAHDNRVIGNLVGTNELGEVVEGFGNTQAGVVIVGAHSNVVRGNLVRGNADGIIISGDTSHDNAVQGNRISDNTDQGVLISASAFSNDIGGLLEEHRNLISANREGVRIESLAHNNVVMANFIGTDELGAFNAETGNSVAGVVIRDAHENQVAENSIRGNGTGVSISGAEARQNIVDQNSVTQNVLRGIHLLDGALNNSIGLILGNLVSANSSGVVIESGAHENSVNNNRIGTNEAGAFAAGFGNSDNGIVILDARMNFVQGNTVRGSTTGIGILGGDGSQVRNNTITNNSDEGILISSEAFDNVIGGRTVGSSNIITNNGAGIRVQVSAHNNQIIDNRIGTDASGELDAALANSGPGISILDAHHTTIEGNVIRSSSTGVSISGSESRFNFVRDNVITHNSEHGVHILDGASDNPIGGLGTEDFNRISENLKSGVVVASGVNNAILRNRIFGNFSLGIDLGDDGVTANENRKDPDSGANNLQNFPQLTLATVGGSRRIAGMLGSTPGTLFVLEFFATSQADSSGFGEAERFVTTTAVTTNASGVASFDVFLPEGEVAGTFLTATATDANGNTSEFAKTIRIEVDNDGDGIPDNMEDSGPNVGDANQDGIPDRQQANVASFRAINNEFVTLAAPVGLTFTQVSPLDNPSPDDAPSLSFDLGFFGFQLSGVTPGGAVDVELILPSNKTPQSYQRYGPTPDNATPHWYNWLYNNLTGAQINGNRITLHFIDGQLGDDDLTANGTILDPGGPAFPLRFTVSTTADSGAGSLRQAILDANNQPGADVIDFQIGSGVQTIVPLTTLPAITGAVTIDGTTQPGFSGSPIIEINGEMAPGSGLTIAASSVTIRGLVINRFADFGIQTVQFGNQQPVAFRVEGNYLGTDVTGMLPRGNRWGIGVSSGNGVIGGTDAAARNVISGNTLDGVHIGVSFSVAVKGNYIGVAADGVSPLGNLEDGILIPANGASNVVIGGLEPGAGNIIAYNQVAGVENWRTVSGNSILSNQIFSNGILGINVGVGVAADFNDSGLTDGTNGNPQNYPVLSSAMSSDGVTTIAGYLRSRPNRDYLLQFFSNTSVTTSGFGQGETFLGSATVTTDASGHADFTATFEVTTSDRHLITATATESGNTSEFSIRLAVGDVLQSVYTVNSADDVDDGVADAIHTSLREAIHAANNHPGLNTIHFAIGSGVQTIAPLTPLPAIIDPIVIDGSTQPGFAGTPVIQLVGTSMDRQKFESGAPVSVHLTGLSVFTNDSTIRGLAINDFYEFGASSSTDTWGGRPLYVSGDNNVIVGNFMGTDVTGMIARRTLLETRIDGNGNQIGGTRELDRNLFAAGQDGGLSVGGTGNVIQGNFIGTDITGTRALPNGRGFAFGSVAVRLSGANTFGGTATGTRNLVSGNLGDAISITGADGSVVQGNFVGTDITGTKMLGNAGGGSGITAQANGNAPLLIGGIDPAARNVISSNTFGIIVGGTGVVVQGNYIGTDVTGTVDFGNLNDGIFMSGTGHLIGGTTPGAGNLISGNNRNGIVLINVGGANISSGNMIQGNRIGTAVDGISALGNSTNGIALAENFALNTLGTGPINNLVGGTESGSGNIIGFNGQSGVSIFAGQRIGVLSNSIFSNGGLGIDLSGDGVTENDTSDADSGANGLQNFPLILTTATDGARTAVTGTLNSTANSVFVIQTFASSDPANTGFAEGETLLGTHYVATDASGTASFTFVFPVAVTADQRITATASGLSNDTSEFSQNATVPDGVIPLNQPPLAHAGGPYTINEGDSLEFFAPSDDHDGDPITISWDINGDGVFGDATGAMPMLTWAQLVALGVVNGPSLFEVSVRVDDGQGHLVTSAPTALNVLNVKPVVDAGPLGQTIFEGSQVDFTGTFIDPGTADTHSFQWHVTASNGQVIADGSDANFSFVPFDNGNYTVTFTVTDSDQESGMTVVNFSVLNAQPMVQVFGLPATGIVGVPIALTSFISDPSSADEAAGLTTSWFASLTPDFDVEFSATTPDFTFTPTEPGIWDVALIVRDKDGGRTVVQGFVDVVGIAPTLDFGDAPDVYPVTIDRDGATHVAGALRLGSEVDADSDGLSSLDADGDGSDDDGIQFVTTLLASATQTGSSVLVEASGTGTLDAWIDFNSDGDWSDTDERVIASFIVTAGQNVVPIQVVAGATAGTTFARFRLSTGGTALPTGAASDGEVEDYSIVLVNGDADSLVEVLMVDPRIEIRSMQGETILADPNVQRFRAPASVVGQLHVVGTTQDDVVAINLNSLVIPNGGVHFDGAAGVNRIELNGDGTSFDFSTVGRTFVGFDIVDLSSTDAIAITLDAAVVKQMSPVGQRIAVITREGDQIHVNESSRWRMTDPVIVAGNFRVTATHVQGDGEVIEAELPHPWQNFLRSSDVNNDGLVTALDALVIINELGRQLYIQNLDGDLADPKSVVQWPGDYYDQNGDDRATALDALRVINEMARISNVTGGEIVANNTTRAFESEAGIEPRENFVEPIASTSTRKIVSTSLTMPQAIRDVAATKNWEAIDRAISDLTLTLLSEVDVH